MMDEESKQLVELNGYMQDTRRRVEKLEATCGELSGVAAGTTDCKRRLDKIENAVEEFIDIATSVKLIATEQQHMSEILKKLGDKITNIESVPGKKWDNLWDKVLTIVLAAALGFLLSHVGF